MATRHLPIDVRRTYRDDSLTAILDAQEHRGPNRRVSMSEFAIDSIRTAESIARRAAVNHGTTPAQVLAFLQDEEAKVRS